MWLQVVVVWRGTNRKQKASASSAPDKFMVGGGGKTQHGANQLAKERPAAPMSTVKDVYGEHFQGRVSPSATDRSFGMRSRAPRELVEEGREELQDRAAPGLRWKNIGARFDSRCNRRLSAATFLLQRQPSRRSPRRLTASFHCGSPGSGWSSLLVLLYVSSFWCP